MSRSTADGFKFQVEGFKFQVSGGGEGRGMQRVNDKYGRGSAAVNGAGFVDLEPGEAKQETSILTYTSRRNRANSRRPSLVVEYGSIRGGSRQWACGIMIGVGAMCRENDYRRFDI